jgi:hypothetical protein
VGNTWVTKLIIGLHVVLENNINFKTMESDAFPYNYGDLAG